MPERREGLDIVEFADVDALRRWRAALGVG